MKFIDELAAKNFMRDLIEKLMDKYPKDKIKKVDAKGAVLKIDSSLYNRKAREKHGIERSAKPDTKYKNKKK